MVSGPASSPAVLSFSRSSAIRSMVAVGIAVGLRASGAGFERGLSFGPVTRDQLAHPALGDAVAAGYLGLLAVLEDDGGDDQAGL